MMNTVNFNLEEIEIPTKALLISRNAKNASWIFIESMALP